MPQSPKLYARLAGFLWLIVIVTGLASMYAVHTPPLVSKDPAATLRAILAAADVYRLALTLSLLSTAAYAGTTVILYLLLRPTNAFVAAMAAGFSLLGLGLGLTSCTSEYGPLVLMQNASLFNNLSPAQLQGIILALIKIQGLTLPISMTFFGLQCFCNGVVIVRSDYFPRLLGVLLMGTGVAYLTSFTGGIWWPELSKAIFPVVMVLGLGGEGGMTLWLLLVGLNSAKWQAALQPKPNASAM